MGLADLSLCNEQPDSRDWTTSMRLFLFFVMCAPFLQCQVRGPAPADATANLPAQKIGPRDLIVIQVYDSPELTRSVRVGADGLIRLPMLKQRIQAEGLMPAELEVFRGGGTAGRRAPGAAVCDRYRRGVQQPADQRRRGGQEPLDVPGQLARQPARGDHASRRTHRGGRLGNPDQHSPAWSRTASRRR